MIQQQPAVQDQLAQTTKLNSSAFPAHKLVQESSCFHRIIQQAEHLADGFTMRPFKESDTYQFRSLQLQWFPLRYGDYFYRRLLTSQYECILAQSQVTINKKNFTHILQREEEQYDKKSIQQKKTISFWQTRLQFFQQQQDFFKDFNDQSPDIKLKIIVGAIVFQFTESRGYLASSWFKESVMGQSSSIYINTLGVIEQLRKKKIALKLLEVCIKSIQKNQDLKLLFLHVINYNTAAIRLYKRLDFEVFEQLPEFYHIDGKEYGALSMGKFFNGGKKKINWSTWLKSFW